MSGYPLYCVSHPFILPFSYCVYQGSFSSNLCQHFFVCCMFCPVDLSIILYDRASKASSHFVGLSSYSWFTSLIRTAPLYSTSLFLSSASSDSCLAYFSAILSSLRN